MSRIANFFTKLTKFSAASLYKCTSSNITPTTGAPNNLLASWLPWQSVPVRTRYVNWQMLRDVKRRRLVKQYDCIRLRHLAIRRNTIVPKEIQDLADQTIRALPRDCHWTRLIGRCAITSRPRGVVRLHRLSRLMFRHLADYNKLSGVIRAKW